MSSASQKDGFFKWFVNYIGPLSSRRALFEKPENAILRRIKLHTTEYQNLHQNTGTVPGICLILATIAPNSVPPWTIKINVFSHICILRNNSKWTDAWLPFFGLFYLFLDRFQLSSPLKFLYSFAHVGHCYAHRKQFGKWPTFCFQPLTRLPRAIFQLGKVGKMSANTSKYRQILVNAGKYWKLAFTTLEVRQNPTLRVSCRQRTAWLSVHLADRTWTGLSTGSMN